MRLVLIDTFALIHRSYHALPKLTAPEGEPIGAVYGFTSLFFKMIKDLKPDYVAAAFDLPEETFRKKAYAEYQAHRPEMPSDLANQISKVKDLLEAFGVPVFSYVGYEADDVIGTAVEKLKNYPDLEIVILTGDLDTLQLVSANVKVYTLKKGLSETVLYDEDAVRERYGFDPERVTDFKGLKGDPSDNIPGVPGIGEKTAKALIMQLGTVENIYRVLGEKSGALRQDVGVSEKIISALRENRDQAFLSKTLATIQRSVPIDISLDAFRSHTPEREKIVSLFQQWGFKTFLARLDELALRPVGG
ncbi:MAG: DNA polymerase I, partial [Parcubacteria group bacterium]|nr:DNA polymerase I [Parcubacteria group bacterium]